MSIKRIRECSVLKEYIKEAVDRFIYRLKEISKYFKLKFEKGDNISLLIEDKSSIRYKVISIGNMLNLDYENNMPILQDGIYSKWMPSTLKIIELLADVNKILVESSITCTEIFDYILSEENKLYLERLNQICYVHVS